MFFANKRPNTIIKTPINNLNHEYIAKSEIPVVLLPKSSKIPIDKNIVPNIPCIIDKVQILLIVSAPLNYLQFKPPCFNF